MIKLGKLTDYAIAVMGQLAHEELGNAHSAHHLAIKTGIPEPTVAKVLKRLSKGNLVASARGAAGGYKLVRPADQVSISEIIALMEGPVLIVACADGETETCGMWGSCPTKSNWNRVNDAIKTALDGVKLKDMLAPPPCTTVHIAMKDINARSA